ncbi:MAG: cation:proton antiporter [Alphaproteobacteria bacterium]|nr:cation:proton antiporter [Alphaproteobacteria bacterium]
METLDFAVISLGVLAFALVSGRLVNSAITPPMVFVAFGLLIGPYGLGIAAIDLDADLIRALAELTLILVLFTDAARIDVGRLRRDHTLPVRLLAIGLPLTFLLGVALAWPLFVGFGLITGSLTAGLVQAALIAAVLAPTDAALGQLVVVAEQVPARVRQALNVESGLNDGLTLPLVLLLIAMAVSAQGEAAGGFEFWARFVGLQLTVGPLVGAAVGFFGGLVVDRAARAQWMTLAFQGLSALGLALIAYAAAELCGGNGFISAFVAGLVMGATKRSVCGYLFDFAETQGQLLTLLTFMIFGAVMVPRAILALDGPALLPVVVYALLSLTVIRMGPVALALWSKRLRRESIVFMGWFGPRGLASILFALLVLQHGVVADDGIFLPVVVVTVLFSVILHGLSAAPGVAWYGTVAKAFMHADPGCPEQRSITELPTRVGRGILN